MCGRYTRGKRRVERERERLRFVAPGGRTDEDDVKGESAAVKLF